MTDDQLLTSVIGSVVGGGLVISVQQGWRLLGDLSVRLQKREPRIAGKWRTQFREEGQEYTESVVLKQRGRMLNAVITLRENDDETDETIYTFTGTFRNLILSGTYASTDQADFERGAILLRYVSKGRFEGQCSFFSSKTQEKVVSSDYVWIQK